MPYQGSISGQDTIKPEYSDKVEYVLIPAVKYQKDDFIRALIDEKPIPADARFSPWFLGELKSLVDLSARIQREMGFLLIADSKNNLGISAEVTIGDKSSLGELAFPGLPGFTMPESAKPVAIIHTHVNKQQEGLLGFSNTKMDFGGDWNTVIRVASDNILHIVIVKNERTRAVIVHRQKGVLLELAREHFNLQERTAEEESEIIRRYESHIDKVIKEEDLFTDGKGDSEFERINRRLADLLGFELMIVDLD